MENKKVLLSVKDLHVKFRVRGRILTAIRGISMDFYENESVAIVGESGSGKSVTSKAILEAVEKAVVAAGGDAEAMKVPAGAAGAAKAEELGYEAKCFSHDDDAAAQLQLFEAAINDKAVAIVCDNAGADASIEAVRKATEAGIPYRLEIGGHSLLRCIPANDMKPRFRTVPGTAIQGRKNAKETDRRRQQPGFSPERPPFPAKLRISIHHRR